MVEKARSDWDELYFQTPNREIPLLPFTQLEEDLIIIASGSPRSGRARRVLPERRIVQMGASCAGEVLLGVTAGEYKGIVERINHFEELRGQWKFANGKAFDNGLSALEARMVAAAALVYQLASGLAIPKRFFIIGKDHNIFGNGKFHDKPEDPLAQVGFIYDDLDEQKVITANSTTVLTVGVKQRPSPDDLLELTDLSEPLPDWVKAQTRFTFMGLKLDSWILGRNHPHNLHALIDFLAEVSQLERLKQVPGGVDLSNRHFAQGVHVLYPSWDRRDHSRPTPLPIYEDFVRLRGSMDKDDGYWACYMLLADINRQMTDEMVGISTKTIEELIR